MLVGGGGVGCGVVAATLSRTKFDVLQAFVQDRVVIAVKVLQAA
jgi:hypothetical protein